jgi:hypothetical protein
MDRRAIIDRAHATLARPLEPYDPSIVEAEPAPVAKSFEFEPVEDELSRWKREADERTARRAEAREELRRQEARGREMYANAALEQRFEQRIDDVIAATGQVLGSEFARHRALDELKSQLKAEFEATIARRLGEVMGRLDALVAEVRALRDK